MRDEKEERKKQARSNKQTRQSNTQCTVPLYVCMCVFVYVCSIESTGGQYTGVRPSVDAEPKVSFNLSEAPKFYNVYIVICMRCLLWIHTPD